MSTPSEKDQKADLLEQLDAGITGRRFVKKRGAYVLTTPIAKVVIQIYHQRFSSAVRLDCGLYFVGIEGATTRRSPKQDECHLRTNIGEILGVPGVLESDLSSEIVEEYLDLVERDALKRVLAWCEPSFLATCPPLGEAFGCKQNLWVNVSRENWKKFCRGFKRT